MGRKAKINWSEYDIYIIENYDKMKCKQMAEKLHLNHKTLASHINKMINRGQIQRKNAVPFKVNKKINNMKEVCVLLRKINELDKKLEVGEKYEIRYIGGGNKKLGTRRLTGTLAKKEETFYLFKSNLGYNECFQKRDFVIGQYKIKEA